jgi:DNA-binding transcriptional regulator YhcF (GntR family)
MEIIAKLSPEDQQQIADQIYNRLLKHLPALDDPDQLLNRRETAEMLKVQPATITTWTKQGKLPVIEMPGGKVTLYSKKDVLKQLHTKYKRYY